MTVKRVGYSSSDYSVIAVVTSAWNSDELRWSSAEMCNSGSGGTETKVS